MKKINRKNQVLKILIPANICWPSRRLEDVFKTFGFEDVFKTSWKTKNCFTEDVFKTSWRHVLKTSSIYLGDKQNVYWGYLYLTRLNVYLTNLYFSNLYLTNLRQIQYILIRTQYFWYLSDLETQAAFLFQVLTFLMTVGCCKISWIQIQYCRTGEARKTKF